MTAQQSKSNRIFLSYAHVDNKVAQGIVQHLEQHSFEVWWDGKMDYGSDIHPVISEALASADLVIGLISPTALKSEWVMWELAQAFDSGLLVLPVLVEGALPENLPPPFDYAKSIVVRDVSSQSCLGDLTDFLARHFQLNKGIERASAHSRLNQQRKAAERRLVAATIEAQQHTSSMYWKNYENPNKNISFHGAALRSSSSAKQPIATASEGFAGILMQNSLSLAICSSQSNKVITIGARDNENLMVYAQDYNRPMSIASKGASIFIAELSCVTELNSALSSRAEVVSDFTDTFRPALSFHTGDVDAHEIAVSDDGEIWIVATKFNCLGTLSMSHSFKFQWMPGGIPELVSEDRCHLNGLALSGGRPHYVSMLGGGQFANHWRGSFLDGGEVHCVRTNDVICSKLSMPHSPRVFGSDLFILNSGAGELGVIDATLDSNSGYTSIVDFSGFPRGLAIHNGLAFVGLSKPRYGNFDEFPLGERLEKSGEPPNCGVDVVELSSGMRIARIEFSKPILEISDVALLLDVLRPKILRLNGMEMEQFITVEG